MTAATVDMDGWTDAERELLARHLAGGTVVANRRRDGHPRLIAWARRAGVYTYVGRPTPWGNPAGLDDPDDDVKRADVIDRYRDYLSERPDLIARLPELRGRVLACWCSPRACHADVLVELLHAEEVAR